uniref:Uncharacterized protein n=1 Tax=Rhizophora mucronata TaxID=61149 RepID=A0A2P2N031_RHIMU
MNNLVNLTHKEEKSKTKALGLNFKLLHKFLDFHVG